MKSVEQTTMADLLDWLDKVKNTKSNGSKTYISNEDMKFYKVELCDSSIKLINGSAIYEYKVTPANSLKVV